MFPHAAAIFLSAFLLFQVQPLAGKELLPWFGGSAAVWSACLLFFQAVLFLGYLYAHLIGTRLAPRRQGIVHLALLALALAFLPIAAGAAWKPPDQSLPVPRILAFLAATLGLPYFLLSANGPLLQRWYTLRSPGAPWRLYALSNAGSLLGLLSYPVLVEPFLSLGAQRTLWSVGYLPVRGRGRRVRRRSRPRRPAAAARAARPARTPLAPPFAGREAGGFDRPGGRADRGTSDTGVAWTALVLALSLTGSLLMAATTHYLCQHVAVIPLLWILPLALYLVSFIVVFAGDRWYRRGLMVPLLAAATLAATATLFLGFRISLPARIAVLLGHLFVGCLVLHGEMARLKPAPRRLTGYYLLLSAGGALGTAFVTFLAPALFTGYWEYHVALAACWGLALVAVLRGTRTTQPPGRAKSALVAGLASLLALVVTLRWDTLVVMAQTVHAERNFYGALQVIERDADDPGAAPLRADQRRDPARRPVHRPAAAAPPDGLLRAGQRPGGGPALRAGDGARRRRDGRAAHRLRRARRRGHRRAHRSPATSCATTSSTRPWRQWRGATSASSPTPRGQSKWCWGTRGSRSSGNWPPPAPAALTSSSWTLSPATPFPPTC